MTSKGWRAGQTGFQQVPARRPFPQSNHTDTPYFMSTATTTSHDTGQHTTSRSTTQPANNPTTQLERSAAQRLRTTMAAVRLAFTWLGVRKTLALSSRAAHQLGIGSGRATGRAILECVPSRREV